MSAKSAGQQDPGCGGGQRHLTQVFVKLKQNQASERCHRHTACFRKKGNGPGSMSGGTKLLVMECFETCWSGRLKVSNIF